MPDTRLAARLEGIVESATLAVSSKAKAMQSAGVDVVGFGAGEPDFDTPDYIKQAAKDALDQGDTKYAPVTGTPALKKAVCEWMGQYGLKFEAKECIISNGGKHALYNAFSAVINPGDEVVIPAPYWVSIPEMVRLTGGKFVLVNCPESAGFKMTPDQLRAAITPRTKVVYLNSPSNPTGVIYNRAELQALADVLVEHPQVIVFSDEIYEKLVFPPHQFTCFGTLRPELRDRLLIFSGMAKTFSMTGWRIGWALGPADIIAAMGTVQGHSTSNPVSFAMTAAVKGLTGDKAFLSDWVQQFAHRGEHMWRRLNQIPEVSCVKPGGAFYCFPKVSKFFGKTIRGVKIANSGDFCKALLEAAHVAMVPGDAFGADEHVRLSFATSLEQIDKGLDRLARTLK